MGQNTTDHSGAATVRQGHENTVLVAKQPIFDTQGRVWGYELLFRDPHSRLAAGHPNKATSMVMMEGFELLRPMLRPKQRCCINFTAEFLEAELPSVLPPDVCVIEILENTPPTEAVLSGLSSLKKQGYLIALDDYVGQAELKPFLALADIVKVDVLDLPRQQIGRLSHMLALYPARLLAEKVETTEIAAFCRSQGFSLFQGHYFAKAEIVSGKRLNPAEITRTRLLSLLSTQDMNMDRVAGVVSSDVYITYNLLKFVNSVYFGLPMKVDTVDRAIKLLGTRKIRQWLLVTALAGMDSSPMSQEIVYISALRAKFLETLAQKRHKSLEAKLFLAGLFSMLETMMQIPLGEIFSTIPLDDDLIQLLSERDGPLASWYHLMFAYEKGEWSEASRLARQLSLNDDDLCQAYVRAGTWSTAVFIAAGAHQERG